MLHKRPDSGRNSARVAVLASARLPKRRAGKTSKFILPAYSAYRVAVVGNVTVMTGVNPQFGVCDDGTVEGAWTLQMPAGPSDSSATTSDLHRPA